MKPGDLIAWSVCDYPGQPGYELGLIIDECECDKEHSSPKCHRMEIFEASKFKVLWSCGKVSRPAEAYLENFVVVQ